MKRFWYPWSKFLLIRTVNFFSLKGESGSLQKNENPRRFELSGNFINAYQTLFILFVSLLVYGHHEESRGQKSCVCKMAHESQRNRRFQLN